LVLIGIAFRDEKPPDKPSAAYRARSQPSVDRKTQPAPPRDLPELDLDFGAGAKASTVSGVDGLVAYWAFDQNLESVAGAGASGSWAGSPQFTEGKTGHALLLKSQERIAYNETVIGQSAELTVAFWVKLDSPPEAGSVLIDFGGVKLACREGTVELQTGQQFPRLSRRKRPPAFSLQGPRLADAVDRWVHWAFVYSSRARRAQYLQDGEVLGSQRYLLPAQAKLDHVRFGPWDGALDDLRVYDAALHDGEVRDLYQARD
jgi:hypothetical protein